MNHLKSWWTVHAAWIVGLLTVLWPSFSQYVASNPKFTLFLAVGAAIIAQLSPSPASGNGTSTGTGISAQAKGFAVIALLLGASLFIAGCSVISEIGTWLPFGVSVFDGAVALVDPQNTVLAAKASQVDSAFSDLEAGVAAAEQAGQSQTGMPKVIAELNAVIPAVQTWESDFQSVTGLNISARDKSYISGGLALVLSAMQGYEATLQAQSGTAATTAMLREIQGPCYGFETHEGHAPYRVWANCDPDEPIDMLIPAAGKPTYASGKAPKRGAWKRQFNALARKYGHPEKQLTLSMAERLHAR